MSSPVSRPPSYRLLGPLEVWAGGVRLAVGGPRAQAVMAMLIANCNRPVSLDELVAATWDRAPATAAHQVRNRVSEIRNVLRAAGLPDDTIRNAGTGYLLSVADGDCDATLFEALTARAQASLADGRLADAERDLTEALSLWYGSALEGLTTAPLAAITAGLTEKRTLAREHLFDIALRLGRHETVIGELRAFAAEHPWRERPVEHMMTALYRAGRQREALDQFTAFSRRLSDDLGLDPGRDLVDLRDRILRHEVEQSRAGAEDVTRPRQAVAWHPPAPLADFVGRRAELAKVESHVRACLRSGIAPIVTISGLPGVGKTSFAIFALHRLRNEFPDGQLYVDLRGHADPRDPVEVLHRFLRTIGVASDAIPSDVDEAADLYRSLLSRNPRPLLLDNAASAAQIAPLMPPAECPVIVTGRSMLSDLDGACFVAMDPLPEPDALALLERAVGAAPVRHNRDAALSIVRSCGHLPLAVRIASAQALAAQGELDDIARRLRDGGRLLDHLTTAERSIRASFQSAFDNLAQADRRMLCDLALVTVDDFPQWIAGVAHGGAEPTVAEASLSRLVQAGFATALGRDAVGQLRFHLHDLVRQFAAEQAARLQSALERRETLLRVVEAWHTLADEADKVFYHSGYFTAALSTAVAPAPIRRHLEDPAKWFAVESPTLLQLARQAAAGGMDRQCWALVWHCETYLTRDARQPELLSLARLGLESARRAGDQLGIACGALMVAYALSQLADVDAAQRFADDALTAAAAAGNVWLQAEILAVQGQLFGRTGATARQRIAFERSVELYLEVGELVSAGERLTGLGEAAAREGDIDAATAYLEKGLELLRQSPATVPLARSLRRLAGVRAQAGAAAEAAELYRECLALLSEVDDPVGELCVRTDLGLTLLDLGDLAEASEHVKHAVALVERVKGPHYMAYARMGQGILLARKGDAAGAAATLSAAADGLKTVPFAHARTLLEWGRVRHRLGDAGAVSVLREAVSVAERIGDARCAGLAREALAQAV